MTRNRCLIMDLPDIPLLYTGSTISDAISVVLSKLLMSTLTACFNRLDAGKEYTTTTHLKSVFRRAEKKGQVTLIAVTKKKQRILIKAIRLLGFRRFIRIWNNPEKRHILIKQFYKIIFVREDS